MRNLEHQPRNLLKKGAAVASSIALVYGLTGSPTQVEASVQRPDTKGLFSLEFGEYQSFHAKAGDVVLGDIAIGPTGTTIESFKQDTASQFNSNIPNNPEIIEVYDTKPNPLTGIHNEITGNITVMKTDGYIYVDDWKAAIIGNVPEEIQPELVQKYAVSMKYLGCDTKTNLKGCIGGVTISEVTDKGINPYQPTK